MSDDPFHHARRGLIAILGVGMLVSLGATLASAQIRGRIAEVGPVVAINAAGDDVRVAGARVSVDGAAARVKAAGAMVEVRGAVEGDVSAAGADVSIEAQMGGKVRAVGARVSVRGRAAGDVTAAGAAVDVDLAIGGALKVAGATVRIGPLTDVGGIVQAAGANVVFEGHVAGQADFAGAVVTLNGRADGPVTVHAERLIVGPQAVIAGRLLVRSLMEPQIDPAAVISGEIVRERPGPWFDEVPEVSKPVFAALFALSIALGGILLLVFARSTFGEAVDHVRFRPLSSLVFGVVALGLLVLIAAILMATVVGFPLGLALLLLVPIVIVLGLPVAAAGLIGWVTGRNVFWLGVGRLFLYLILGAIVVAGLGLVPVTGPWIVVAAILFGVGGFLRATLWRFRIIKPAAPLVVTPGVGTAGDPVG